MRSDQQTEEIKPPLRPDIWVVAIATVFLATVVATINVLAPVDVHPALLAIPVACFGYLFGEWYL